MKKKILSILFALVLVASLSLVTAMPVGAEDGTDLYLFDDDYRTTVQVRSDADDDYARYSVKVWVESENEDKFAYYIYPNMWGFSPKAEDYTMESEPGTGYNWSHTWTGGAWQPVTLPFAALNADDTAFDVERSLMKSVSFYLVCRDSRFTVGDEVNFQIDNIKLTNDAGGERVIDNFDDGTLRWSYQPHTDDTYKVQTVACTLPDVDGRGKVLNVQVTDMEVVTCEAPDWNMTFMDIVPCLTADARDSFIWGQDWSDYDNITFDWRLIDSGTRRDWADLHLRTDMAPPTEIWVADTGSDDNFGTKTKPFTTIQKGIDFVAEFGMVNVAAGTYYETIDVTVDGLTIQSLSGNPLDTIIDADGADDTVVTIKSSDVTISGFTITGAVGATSADYSYQGNSGIYMELVTGCHLSNLIITDITRNGSGWCNGISIQSSPGNIFASITISNISGGPACGQMHGLILKGDISGSHGNSFTNITVDTMTLENTANNLNGIMLWNKNDDNTFENIKITNLTAPIAVIGLRVCDGSAGNSFESTEISSLTATEGIACALALDGAYDDTFDATTISDIVGSGEAYGVMVYRGSHDNFLTSTSISGLTGTDTYGIHFGRGDSNDYSNSFNGGSISGAKYGVYVGVNCPSNSIHYTDIVGNTEYGVYSDTVTLDATYNWWGDVAGPKTDLEGDLHNPYENFTGGDAVSDGVDYLPWLIQIELVEGWNIVSMPIAVANTLHQELDPALVDPAYYFDSSTQDWWNIPEDASPMDAWYIKMTEPVTVNTWASSEATFPWQKEMKVGWNFVSLAELYEMDVDEALSDALYGTGEAGLVGYSRVKSPSLNGAYWTYLRETTPNLMPTMIPTKGYWIFMVNDGVLGGFTETPIVEVAKPIPEP